MRAEQIVLNTPYFWGNCVVTVKALDGDIATIEPMADRKNGLTFDKNVISCVKPLKGAKLLYDLVTTSSIESKLAMRKFYPKKLNVSNLKRIGERSTRYDKNLIYSKRLDLKHKFRLPVKDTEGNACVLEFYFSFNESCIELESFLYLVVGMENSLSGGWVRQFDYSENAIYEFLYDLLENRVKADTVDDREAIRVSKNLVAMCKTYAEQLGVNFEVPKKEKVTELVYQLGKSKIEINLKAKLDLQNVLNFRTYSNAELKWEVVQDVIKTPIKLRPFTLTIDEDSLELFTGDLPKQFYRIENGINVLYKNVNTSKKIIAYKTSIGEYVAISYGNSDIHEKFLELISEKSSIGGILDGISSYIANYIKR